MSRQRETDRSDLSAFLDGQLPPQRAEQIANALTGDADLRAELEALEATRRALADLPTEPAPESLHDAVMEHLERQRLLRAPATPQTARPLRWLHHLATAAIVLLTVGLGFYLHSVLSKPSWVARVEQAEEAGPQLARDVAVTAGEPSPEPRADGLTVFGILDGATQPEQPSPPYVDLNNDAAAAPMSPQPTRAKPAKGGRYAETPPLVGPPLAAKSRGDVPAGPPIPPVASEPETVGRKWGRVRLRGHAPGAFDYAASNEPPIDLPVAGEGRRAGRGGRVSKANHLDLYLGQRHVGLRSVALGTTDVARTSRRVSEVLKRNRILPLAANSNGVVDELAMRTTSRSNSFYNVRPSPDVNQIVFYVTEGQAGEIVEQLQAIETTETLALDALRSPRARAAGAPKTQVEFNIAAADDVVELNARIENRGTRPSGTDGMGMGGMGMGGMGMGGAAFGGGRGGGGPSSPAQQAVESDRDGEHLAQASELANRSMMLRPKPGGPVVSGSGAGDDAKRDAEVHDTMSEQAGSRLDMTMGTRFAGVPERSEQMGRGIVTQARQQVTRGMGRLVQVVVTISKRGSVATSKPSTPTTQPAPATQPSPTSAPAAR